ncbi:hypothetical protein [Parasedimentitalea psychrophila]|uniref:AAA+ family ATPase n=1 Tax=Parasedimentitalea psychrophila TaxID=2997337 RepID=A0A9Y2P5V3_9RHOB|nr:hypothetical protein [Parasedimentitalea psychrophila]WIY24000.1 hypothetical protein QPJ95_15405 [Parasedimentitalea psychrophila]
MKHIVLPLIFAALLAAPTYAQETEPGPSLMEQGMELFFEGLREEMAPALDDLQQLADDFAPDMQGFLRQMGPALAKIAAEVEDWSTYEMPEILPNGDIIIRKKTTDSEADEPEAGGQTDI